MAADDRFFWEADAARSPVAPGHLDFWYRVSGLLIPADGDLLSAQDASPSGQFAQQSTLRMMAQGAALNEVANSNSRRPLTYDNSFNCATKFPE